MKAKRIKLTVDLWLRTDTKGNENCLDKIGYEIIQEYLMVRRDEQSRDEEDFEAQNGYIIEDYEVDIVKEKKG